MDTAAPVERDLNVYEIDWRAFEEVLGLHPEEHGKDSPFRNAGGITVFFILRRETESWIYVVVGRVEEKLLFAWWNELYSYGWLASGSGSATHLLHLSPARLKELMERSKLAAPESRMVKSLMLTMRKRQ